LQDIQEQFLIFFASFASTAKNTPQKEVQAMPLPVE
jgi:hypothetical protein